MTPNKKILLTDAFGHEIIVRPDLLNSRAFTVEVPLPFQIDTREILEHIFDDLTAYANSIDLPLEMENYNADGSKLSLDRATFLHKLRTDPVYFSETIIGFTPYEYQAKLLRATSKRIVAVWGRQSGKTTCIAIKVIHFVFTQPKRTVLIISKGLRQSIIMFSVITSMVLGNPVLNRSIKRITRTQLWFNNGSTVIALPCSSTGANLRGHTADMVVMDEAAFMPETVISQVIFPMLATTGGVAIMLSTPWGRNHIFYRAFCNPIYWVQKVKSKDCPKITQEFLDEQHLMIGDLRFRIEYNAEFIEDANALFNQDMIRRCVALWDDSKWKVWTDAEIEQFTAAQQGTFVLGGDIGKRIDHSVISLFKLEHFDRISEETGRPEHWSAWRLCYKNEFPLKTKLFMVTNKIKWLDKKFNIRAGCIDQTGIGEGPVEELSRSVNWIEGIPLYAAQTKHAVAMYAYTKIEREEMAIPNDLDLITQMNEQSFGYSQVKEKIITEEKGILVYWHPEGRHDDQLWSIMMAMYATRNI